MSNNKKISFSSSSGSGFNYEHIIQSQLILDLFYSNNYFNNKLYQSSTNDRMIFQARSLGYNNDDFVILQDERKILYQITEERINYTSKSSKFNEFINNAYQDYANDKNIENILVKSNQNISKDKNIEKFLNYIKNCDYKTFSKTQKSKIEEEFLNSINSILSDNNLSDSELFEFIKTINIITIKNDNDFSIEYKNLINQNIKNLSCNQIFNLLVTYCFNNSMIAKTINYLDIYILLSQYLTNKSSILNNFLEDSNNKLNNISDSIGNFHINRDKIVDNFINTRSNVNIISGNPGVGKSATIKNILNKINNNYKIFIDAEEICKKNNFFNTLVSLMNVLDDCEIFIDRTEKIFENDNSNFLNFLKACNKLNITFVIRDYSLSKLKEQLIDSGYDLIKIKYFCISEISIKDVEDILKKNNIIIKNTNLKELLTNLFYLQNIIRYSAIIASESKIVNEFNIKEKLFEAITNDKESYKNALISVFEKKYNINEQNYLNFSNEIQYFIKQGILIDNHGNYSFSHDKYDDLVLFYILEGKYQNNLENLLTTFNNIIILRGLNIWLRDRIIMNQQECFLQIIKLIPSNKVLALFKNEIIKILFTENLVKDFIETYGIDRFFEDEYTFNIIISCSLIINPINIILDKDKQKYATYDFLTMNQYIIPNRKYLDIIAKIIALNKDKIKTINIDSLMKILKAIYQYLKLDNKLIYELHDYYSIFYELLSYSEDYSLNDTFRKDFLSIYYNFVIYDMNLAENHLNDIITSNGNRHKLSVIELYILDNLTDMKNMCIISELYAKKLSDKICSIILFLPFTDNNKKNIYYHEKNNYGLKDFSILFPSAFSNQLYFVIKEVPKKTFNAIDIFLNKLIDNYDSKVSEYVSFEFENNKNVPLDINQYVAYRGFGNLPELIKVVLMGLERFILLDLKDTDRDYYLNELLKNPNSLMKISLIISIVRFDPKRYFEKLLLICNYKELLILDLNLTISEQTTLFMHLDPFNFVNRSEREKASKFYDRKKSLWDILLELQSYKEYQNKIWKLYEKLEKEIGKTDDEMIIRKRLHDFDLRNYVPSNEVIKDNKKYVEFLPKDIEDLEVKEFLKKRDNSEYVKHISIENSIKEILDNKKENIFSVSDLKNEYFYNIKNSYGKVYNDFILLLSLKIKAKGLKEKRFQHKAKKIIISKLASKDMIIWEKIYRNYLLSIIEELYNSSKKSKSITINYIIHCLGDTYMNDNNLLIIKQIEESNIEFYNSIIKSIYNKNLEETTKSLLILKIVDKNNLTKYINEVENLIKYICNKDNNDRDYMMRYFLSDFISANIDNNDIRNLIYNHLKSDNINYNFIEEIIKNTIVCVDNSKISNKIFWQFINDISVIIFEKIDNNKNQYYITNSSSYRNEGYYIRESRIIRLLLMDYMGWNEKVHKWKAFDTNGKKIYLSIVKMFLCLPVGISAFCRTIWQFRENFSSSIILEYSDEIEKNSSNNAYFNDVDTEIVLEFLIIDIYNKKLDNLSNDELIKLSNVIMNFILYTSSYRINYIYQQLLPTIYK